MHSYCNDPEFGIREFGHHMKSQQNKICLIINNYQQLKYNIRSQLPQNILGYNARNKISNSTNIIFFPSFIRLFQQSHNSKLKLLV